MSGIIATPAVQDLDLWRCRRLLSAVVQDQPRYVTAALLSPDGHTICAPDPVDPGINASKRSFFRLALESGGFVVGDLVTGDVTGKRTIHLAKSVRNRAGMVTGVVALALSADWLGQQLEGLALPPWATAVVIDRNGITIARSPDPRHTAGQPMPAANRAMLEGNRAVVIPVVNRDGRELLVGYSPTGANPKGLLVAVGLDRAAAFAEVTRANRLGLQLIVGALALALLLTAMLGWRLIRYPINLLLVAAGEWRGGNLAARTGFRSERNEFGRLGAAFDDMAETLQARDAALRASEGRLQLARETAGLGVWERDLATDTVMWSDEEWLLHGLDPRPGPCERAERWANVPPEDQARGLAEMEAAIADPAKRYDLEYRVRLADGRVRWLRSRATVVHDADGKAVRMVGVTLDVTEGHEKEARLRRQGEELERRVREEVAAREAAQARAAQAERLAGAGPAGRRHRARLQQRAAGGGRSRVADRAPPQGRAGHPPPRPDHLGGGRPRCLHHPAPARIRPPRRPAGREAGCSGGAA